MIVSTCVHACQQPFWFKRYPRAQYPRSAALAIMMSDEGEIDVEEVPEGEVDVDAAPCAARNRRRPRARVAAPAPVEKIGPRASFIIVGDGSGMWRGG